MGLLKTIALTGGVVLTTAFGALAADLAPPPPPMPAAPVPLRGSLDTSGFYLRGDIGVGALQTTGLYEPTVAAAPGGSFLKSSIGDTVFAGVGVGYQINNWLRFDVTGEYRTGAGFTGLDSYQFTCTFAGGSCPAVGSVITRNNLWSGRIASGVFLANVYADLGTYAGITPFVGVGVGGARHVMSQVRDFDPSDLGGGGVATTGIKWNAAWALHAGLGYEVMPNLKLEMAYRYLNMGSARSGTLYCTGAGGGACGGPLTARKLESHDLKFGMRWMLGGAEPAPVAMGYPAVVSRRY